MKDEVNQQSLYVPAMEHDSCGTGLIAQIQGVPSHGIVTDALRMLVRMEHRGACGSDSQTGDGAGILVQIPHEFFSIVCQPLGIELPKPGLYGVGTVFFPQDDLLRSKCKELMQIHIQKLGLSVLGYREVPINPKHVGTTARNVAPKVEQIFVGSSDSTLSQPDLERKLFVFRRSAHYDIIHKEPEVIPYYYVASLSTKTIVYKGQFRTYQLGPYYLDLQDEHFKSAFALVHSRFSTNTFPRWRLAQPFRFIAHNGEINTIRGNVNWMRAKEALLKEGGFTQEELECLKPVCDSDLSDSRNLDSIIELLVMAGRPIQEVIMMLIPEAWQHNQSMAKQRKAFFQYHSTMMEPWDGPAAVCFTDGVRVGAALDRNGLRPSRYCLTRDNRFILASETGALPIDPVLIKEKGRLQPGKMMLADLSLGKICYDDELKEAACNKYPYGAWLKKQTFELTNIPSHSDSSLLPLSSTSNLPLLTRQQLFGMTAEELKIVLTPMVVNGKEALGSMGADTPLACLSQQSQHISNYFKQLFAQVSNPPIDPIREKLVMSLRNWIGMRPNILERDLNEGYYISVPSPVLTNRELATLKGISHPYFNVCTIDAVFDRKTGLKGRIEEICLATAEKVKNGCNILIVSDRCANEEKAPIPSLMVCGAIHHALIKCGLRSKVNIIAETGDAREVHHFATLIGYGTLAINPYLAFESISDLAQSTHRDIDISEEQFYGNYIKAIEKGLLKVFSKMGISTIQSYQGAQIFEILGIDNDVVDTCFAGTVSRIKGMGFDDLALEIWARHDVAFRNDEKKSPRLALGGIYQWRRRGEAHLLNPETIHLLQHSTSRNRYDLFKKYAAQINHQQEKAITVRSLFSFNKLRPSISIEEVEPLQNIFKRFATGAMSFGSLSHEAHTTLAIAMNRIGGKSNSGEGGEDPIRFTRKENGDLERSATKQIASGRFGVTMDYLTNADELQIKMAQGAKPGEGGQLPGHKVDAWIGRVRHATPGVGLISPPPHHDIYSIEDLAQLIFDLKNANRGARISVKLVSEAGVGTIAAGVTKAKADHILISGHDGGTGASPLSSIRHAGLPWELGLSEAHQTLVINNLRSRVTLQVDGQIRTGRDLAIATLLGAEEWSLATAALIVEGCIMMRKCHLNTCPVGIATQNPELRKLFSGNADHLVNFFTFLGQEMREIMAELGFRTVNEMVGQSQFLKVDSRTSNWKLRKLDLSPILYKPEVNDKIDIYCTENQDHGLANVLDWKLFNSAKAALQTKVPIYKTFTIQNTDRSVGTLLSNEITKQFGPEGLPVGTVHYKFNGSAGQSFGAFTVAGLRLELEGEANDYFAKGLSGGQLIIYPDKCARFEPGKNTIIGNVGIYGATGGEVFIRGIAGERFAVRNSGARAVVEGVGDHGCEYMTGGVVIILGTAGRNFAAGMSGGMAYIYDPGKVFEKNCNREMVDLETIKYDDIDLVKKMISKHYTFTGSRIALKLMTDWSRELANFVKVMPKDYKAALLNSFTTTRIERASA